MHSPQLKFGRIICDVTWNDRRKFACRILQILAVAWFALPSLLGAGEPEKRVVIPEMAELKAVPKDDAPVEAVLTDGEQVTLLKEIDKWSRVRTEDGKLGWMRRADLRLPPETGVKSPADATKENPFVNSLGMKFVPVPETKLLMCIHETRVKDYRAYADAVGDVDTDWKGFEDLKEDYPVACVNWTDANAFCAWLSRKEGKTYRLPTDAEWSLAVGLGPETGNSPKEKSGKAAGYPWGSQWPPPANAGNYSLDDDGFKFWAPVGSYPANKLGICDLGGNVWEWCRDLYEPGEEYHVLRGGAWRRVTEPLHLRSSFRGQYPRSLMRRASIGFRCVVEP